MEPTLSYSILFSLCLPLLLCIMYMEPPFSYSILFSLGLPLLLCIIFLEHKRFPKSTLKLPPGPRPLPFIGNLHNLIGSLQHHKLRDLSRQYGSLIFLKIGEIPTVVLSSPDAAEEMMKTHDAIFATRPTSKTIRTFTNGGRGILFSSYGEYWRQMRKICILELLSMKHVKSFRSIREEEVGGLIEHISLCSSHGVLVNVRKEMVKVSNDITARVIIGSKYDNQELFLQQVDKWVELLTGLNLADLFPSCRLVRLIGAGGEAMRSRRVIDLLLEDIIKQHREKKAILGGGGLEQEDLVQVLLRIYDEGNSLDMESAKQLILDLFIAGSESSSTVVEWAMSELIRNPTVLNKAQLEVRQLLEGCKTVSESDVSKLSYLHLVIKETLRLHPPTPLLGPRECRETCRISGYDIPKGTTVLVNMWAIGRDPKYWEDPEKFMPERFANNIVDFKGLNFEFVPFGAGKRMCPGMSFGLANVELPLANLLYHFDWKLSDGAKPEEIDMREAFGIATHRKTPLNLLALPYKSCAA